MATTVICDNTTGSPVGDYAGTDDCELTEASPTTNSGAGTIFWLSKFFAADYRYSLLKFSGLSNIASPVTVSSVTLGLWLTSNVAPTRAVDFRRLLRNWVEAQATWNIYSTGNNWTTGGALGDATDRVAAVSAQMTVDTTTGQYYTATDTGQLAQDVADWINGVNPNYGWHLSHGAAWVVPDRKEFRASEGTDGQRPYLSVTWAAAGGLTDRSSPVAFGGGVISLRTLVGRGLIG